MNRILLSIGVGLLAASAALAGPQQTKATPKAKAVAAPTTIACAVETGNKTDIKKATAAKMFADYKGNRYFFCCDGCPQEFKKDPEKYAKNAHIKTPAPAAPAKKAKA
jgi:YHS domain-containing protein